LCDYALKYVDFVNDLGVLVDLHLTFIAHINSVVQKAAQCICLIFKAFKSRDKSF